MGFIEELKWRGLLHDIMPGTEDLLKKNNISGYIGFDPTADSLHIGNLVPVMLLTHFQRSGHTPIVLVGGATGMIGDPSGKSQERNLLDVETINHNLACQQKQLEKFLNFSSGENKAKIVNNYDWFKDLKFLDFIRDVGKHITVSYMMAKDSVKTRLETGLSFTEFSYQLVQGYDFYWLYENEGCLLQMGGSDQWGNIVTGTEIIRRKAGGEAFALTAPLITKADGSKFGKSEGGNIWLDPEKTSPYKFYQYWLNASDDDIYGFLKTFSLKTQEELEELQKKHLEAPHERAMQHALAEELTIRVHSQNELDRAKIASTILFGKATKDELLQLNESEILSVFEGVPQATVEMNTIQESLSAVDLLVAHTSVFSSNGEARRMLKSNAVSINKEKISEQKVISAADIVGEKFIIVQKGKRNYFLINVK